MPVQITKPAQYAGFIKGIVECSRMFDVGRLQDFKRLRTENLPVCRVVNNAVTFCGNSVSPALVWISPQLRWGGVSGRSRGRRDASSLKRPPRALSRHRPMIDYGCLIFSPVAGRPANEWDFPDESALICYGTGLIAGSMKWVRLPPGSLTVGPPRKVRSGSARHSDEQKIVVVGNRGCGGKGERESHHSHSVEKTWTGLDQLDRLARVEPLGLTDS